MKISEQLKKMNLEEMAQVRKLCDSLIMEKLYSLKSGISDSLLATEFAEKRSFLVVKDELKMGRYNILVRPPEYSTLKLDLSHEDEKRFSTKQVRISFIRGDWKRITGI